MRRKVNSQFPTSLAPIINYTQSKMSSKAVVCSLLATALVLLIVLSKNSKPDDHRKHDALSRRLGSPIFDPIVAKGHRKAEENTSRDTKAAAAAAASSSYINAAKEDMKYYDEDGTLNLRLRLMVLFPVLDVAPQDGMVDSKELEAWLTQQAVDRLDYRTRRELELRDKDGDASISFYEYLPQFTKEDIERNDTRYGEAGWWMEQFNDSDVDRNGNLNLYEFRDFLHPEDSRNERIQRRLLREKLRQMDKDNDQRLNLLEFEVGAYNDYKFYLDYESGSAANISSAAAVFDKLDVDHDKLLRVEELKPLFKYLKPGELVYAKYYTNYLIQEADENRDGKLTLDEMLNHEHIFYNTVYDNGKHENEYYSYHDEL
ncbi:uncharacterized protein [Coffea arabica]|uniref:EF-hand domain-containing protein n=1 Tax=Coffea arabica TaxID=13443 RepID=A0A6P6W2S1_COFAR|nr:reticulocalbin-2-like [Coffea arabica]